MANILSQSKSFMADVIPVRRLEMYELRLLFLFCLFNWMQPTTSARTVAIALASALFTTGIGFWMEWKGNELVKRHETAHMLLLLALLAIVLAVAWYGILKRDHSNINEPGHQIQAQASRG
jgi:hypothetical protein